MHARVCLAWVMSVLTLVACAGSRAERDERAALAVLEHVAHERTPGGEAIVVVRDYVEPTKVEGRDERHRVQYVWNYSRGIAQRRIWDVAGLAFQEEDLPGLTLNATADELAFALASVRADPKYADVIKPDTILHGGFSVRETGSRCDGAARCIHVFGVESDGETRVLHAVFSLGTGRLLDHDYDPALSDASERLDSATGEKQ